jgi:AsmA protein
MKRPRVRLRWLVPLAILLLPPLFWSLILAITPTEWARTRIVARLRAATGRSIQLGSLKIGALGGVHLANLEIGAPGSDRDPWLRVASARINVSVLQLLAGQLDPSEIEIRGLKLRVLRRQDGTLELSDLLRSGPSDPHDGAECDCPGPSALEVWLRDAEVTVIDEPSRTRLELTQVEGRATWQGRLASIPTLHGTLNGGPFNLAASLDRTGAGPAFEGRLRAEGVNLNDGTNALVYLIPVLSGTVDDESVNGRLDANLYLRGQGATRDALRRSLVGQGSITLDPVALDGSRFLAEVDQLVDLPGDVDVGTVKSDFTIKSGHVTTDNLTLNVGGVPIVLAGWTDFDGNLDYRVRTDRLTDQLPGKAREFLADLAIEPRELAAVRVLGTLSAMRVSMEGVAAESLLGKDEISLPLDDRRHLRDLGRRFRDRILR